MRPIGMDLIARNSKNSQPEKFNLKRVLQLLSSKKVLKLSHSPITFWLSGRQPDAGKATETWGEDHCIFLKWWLRFSIAWNTGNVVNLLCYACLHTPLRRSEESPASSTAVLVRILRRWHHYQYLVGPLLGLLCHHWHGAEISQRASR